MNWNRIVPGTIRSVVREERPIIRSDGTSTRDYFYVEDGASAYMTLAEHLAENRELAGEAFNFSNETPVTVLDLARQIVNLMGSTLEPHVHNTADNEIPHQSLVAAKARETLGWSAQHGLDDGLAKTITWYRDFLRTRAQ